MARRLAMLTPLRARRASTMLGAAALAVCIVLSLAVPALAAAINKDAVAVIIGNKDYAGSVPDVDFAHNDAQAMKRFVIDVLGFREGNVIVVRDATKGKLETLYLQDPL